MNFSLAWKYFYRESLWLKWLPMYVLLLEIVIPLKFTVFPFLLLRNTFCEFNSMVPYSIRSIQITNYTLLEVVQSNNLMLVVVGSIAHLLAGLMIFLLNIFLKNHYDVGVFFEFIPLLLFSTMLGNLSIHVNFSNFKTPRVLHYIIFMISILLVYFVNQYSIEIYLVTTAIGVVGIFVSYKMLDSR